MFPFEQGALEMVALGALALIVLGPKELPIVMRRLGQFMAKMRGMAAEFRASFDELARQSEIDELRKEVDALRTGQFGSASSTPPNQAQTYDYNPYDNAGSGLDNSGFGFPPGPNLGQPPIVGEGLPTATAEVPAEPKPARKPRARKPAPAIEAEAEPAPAALAARKPRARKVAQPETPGG
jgi:sec-independent protein translocase protein TatB